MSTATGWVVGISIVLIMLMGYRVRRIQGGRVSWYWGNTTDDAYDKIQRRRETMDDGFGGALGGPRPPDPPTEDQPGQASDR